MTKPVWRVFKWMIVLGVVAAGAIAYWRFQQWLQTPLVPRPDPPRVKMPPKYGYDPTKIDLHIGSHRFRVGVDYIMDEPFVDGDFSLLAVWPSMRTTDEEVQVYDAKVNGKPGVRVSDTIQIRVARVPDPDRYTDDYKGFIQPRPGIAPRIDETSADLGLYIQRNKGPDNYWAMESSVVTPYQKVPYAFDCSHEREDAKPGHTYGADICDTRFRLNREISIRIIFNKTHLKDWKSMYFKVLEFLKSIEEPQ